MRLEHRLDVVARVRRNQRDVHQQGVAIARRRQVELVARRDKLADERASLLDQLRHSINSDVLDVSHILNVQHQAEVLMQEVEACEIELIEAHKYLESCLSQLVAADQSLRALERLVERHIAKDRLADEKSAEQARDDAAVITFWHRG